jgi:Tol biopolymer transport system component
MVLVLFLISSAPVAAHSQKRAPTIDDLLNVRSAGGAQISPQCDRVAYTVSETDFKQDAFVAHIWMADVRTGNTVQLTRGEKSAGNPQWSPDGLKIAFSATINPDLINGGTSDIYVLTLADNAVKKIVSQPDPDNIPNWSPDSKQIVFSSAMDNPKYFHSNTRLALLPAHGGLPRSITDSFDEQPNLLDWNADGIYFPGSQKTAAHLFRVDPATANIVRPTNPDNLIAASLTFSRDGKRIAFSSPSPNSLSEIFISDLQNFAPRKLTSMSMSTSGQNDPEIQLLLDLSVHGSSLCDHGQVRRSLNTESGLDY